MFKRDSQTGSQKAHSRLDALTTTQADGAEGGSLSKRRYTYREQAFRSAGDGTGSNDATITTPAPTRYCRQITARRSRQRLRIVTQLLARHQDLHSLSQRGEDRNDLR
jgi:hypothetical protein